MVWEANSASIAFLDFGDLREGPIAKFEAARKQYNYSELSGLGDVKAAVELGGFVEYYPVDWFRTRVELREGVVGHNGTVADFSADFIVPVIRRLTISAGPRFTWENTQATSPYLASMPCKRWLQGCRFSTPKVGRTRRALAFDVPEGSQ